MKVLSLFSGIGAFEKALDNLEIPYELVGFSEIDKYAVKSYCAIHGVDESMNLGDITKIDEKALSKDIDLITYGFPCNRGSEGYSRYSTRFTSLTRIASKSLSDVGSSAARDDEPARRL